MKGRPNWPIVKLESLAAKTKGAIVGGPFGSDLVSRDYVQNGVPVIRGINLPKNSRFSCDDFVFVSESKADKLQLNCAKPDDLVFTQRGTLGQVGIVPKDTPFPRFLISQSQMKMTANLSEADPLYIYYYFRLPSVVCYIENHALQSGVPHINLGILRGLEIVWPPLQIQRKIAAILSTYDDLIENNNRRIALLEKMAEEIYREWFVRFRFPGHEKAKFERGVPLGWDLKPSIEVFDVLSGGTPKTDVASFWDGELPFFTPKDAKDSIYVLDTEKKITEKGLSACNSRLYGKDTIFITARGTVGKIVLSYRDMAMNQSCYALLPKGEDDIYFFFYAMKNAISYVKGVSKSGVFDNIIVDTFKSIPLLIPDGKLLIRFNDEIGPLVKNIGILLEAIEVLRETRNMLLPRLISGKLSVENLDIRFPPSMEGTEGEA